MLNDHISFWGRGLDDYTNMFDLDDLAKGKKILSVADGPSTLNMELTRAGVDFTSVDPRYRLSRAQMCDEFNSSYGLNREHFYHNRESYFFASDRDMEDLLEKRRSTFHMFIADFERNPLRYQAGQLPSLAFEDDSFDLCLCANFLFLFDDLLEVEFHVISILEMLRVAAMVKIFPVYGRGHLPISPYLEQVIGAMKDRGISCDLRPSRYKVWNGENSYMLLRR